MSHLGTRADRAFTALELERVALSVRRQLWPDVDLLEPIDLGRLAEATHTVIGPRGRIRIALLHDPGLPRHRWLDTEILGDETVLIHANPASWCEVHDAPRTRFGLSHELGHAVIHTPQLRDLCAGRALDEHAADPDWDLERQADRFAAHLLCPDAALDRAARMGLPVCRDGIAERWGLGDSTAAIRRLEWGACPPL